MDPFFSSARVLNDAYTCSLTECHPQQIAAELASSPNKEQLAGSIVLQSHRSSTTSQFQDHSNVQLPGTTAPSTELQTGLEAQAWPDMASPILEASLDYLDNLAAPLTDRQHFHIPHEHRTYVWPLSTDNTSTPTTNPL